MFGRRGAMSWLDDARPAAGAVPATRLLQGRRVRRGRTGHLRSLLLRRHVDEDDGNLACADAGSGSHNFDAPYLARQRCRGESASSNTYGDRAPYWFGGARRLHKEQIEALHTGGILPSFGPQGCIKPYCCFVDCIVFLLRSAWCYSTHEPLARPSVAMGVLLLLRAHGASFYMLKGVTHRWQRRWGQKWENVVVGTAACTVVVQCYHT